MRTFFIYDTAYCKADEDDPKDALLYYFPTQTYESQCYSLCGQIVGVAKFLKTAFSCPSVISLDREKFALHWSGRYLFALGGQSDAHGNMLKQELLFLCGIFCFYHGSINNLLKTCKNDRKKFLDKMELSLSRYITLSQCFNNLLNIPVNPMPLPNIKKYSEAVSKANELLRMCQLSATVIAGAVYCNSRVLSSQLTPELTSYLALLSNENASSLVTNVITPIKDLPPNLELKYVYISQRTIHNIVKHNHIHMGSAVRVKADKKPPVSQSSSYCVTVTSGSEGDIDSGHCTEVVYQRSKNKILSPFSKKEIPQCFGFDFKNQFLCCSMHAEVFKKVILKSRNKIFQKYWNYEFVTERLKHFDKKNSLCLNLDPTRARAKQKAKKGTTTQITSSHLICHQHANNFSATFLNGRADDHKNLLSTSDLEFSCYFCINHRFTTKSTPSSLKNWNSEMEIADFFSYIPNKSYKMLEYASATDKPKKGKPSKCKVQILKCRTKIDTCTQCSRRLNNHSHHTKKHCSEQALYDMKYRTSNNHVQQNSRLSRYYFENMENNDLDKYLLCVQRFESNMVVLLLNKNYDENIFTYLWNCGFTFLKDLEYLDERKIVENNKPDTANYILIYDNVKKILKEHPRYQASLFAEKHIKNSMQALQEDFQSNPKLQMFSLLCANQNIFAYQTKEQSAFYLQHDLNSKKSESLSNLTKKAVHRLEKYMNFSL